MYRGLIYFGRRGIAIHAISGLDIALWDIKGKALGKPVYELLGTPERDRVRAYASMLMPDTTDEVTRARSTALREQNFTAVKLGWGPLGQDPDHDVELAAAAAAAGGDGVEIMIDAGPRLRRRRRDRDPGRARVRAARHLLARGAVRAGRVRGVRGARRHGRHPRRRRRAGRDVVGLSRADRTRATSTSSSPTSRAAAESPRRCGSRRSRASTGVATVPHAWKSGIIKAASLHCNAVLPDGIWQEYCVAETPINTTLTVAAPADRGGRLRRGPDRARPRRRSRRGRAREPQDRPVARLDR